MRRGTLIPLLLVSLVSAPAPAWAVPLFRSCMIFEVGEVPEGQDMHGDQAYAGAADLNGDGRADLVVANYTGPLGFGKGHTVSVLLTNAAPALPTLFRSKVNYEVGTGPGGPYFGDFDGDSRLDVLTVNADSSVTVLFGDGAGGFGGRVDTDTGRGTSSFFVASLNGDAYPDIAYSGILADTTWVFFGNGAGSFTPGPVTASVHGSLMRDVNADGRPDLVGRSSTAVTVSLGNGNGTFLPPIYSGTSNEFYAMDTGDCDSDGILDLVLGSNFPSPSPQVAILHGYGDGSFIEASVFPVPGNQEPLYSIVLGDVDSDGRLDIVGTENRTTSTTIPEGANTLVVLFGDGTGTFPDQRTYDIGKPALVSLGDFDGNGLLDVATTNQYDFYPTVYGCHAVSVLRNLAARELGGGDHRATVHQPAWQTVADVNRDGIPDLLVSDNNAYIEVHLGDGSGGYSGVVLQPMTPSNSVARFALGDVNRDGKPDIVASGVNLLYGNGDGTFSAGVPIGSSGNTVEESLADLNRDGILDLLLLGGNFLNVALGAPGGTFGVATSYPLTINPRDLRVDDLNRDGKLDVAVATPGGIARFLGNGDGTLAAQAAVDPSRSFMDVTSGDFNRDGFPDLAARDESYSGAPPALGISVYLGDGMGGFGPRTTFPAFDGAGFEIASWDVNRDGSPDIVASSQGQLQGLDVGTFTTVGAWLGNGTGTLRRDSDFLIGLTTGINRVSFGDIDRDGQMDLLGRNDDYVTDLSSVPYISILRGAMPGFTGSFASHLEYLSVTGVSDLAVADFNRDGRADIAAGGGPYVLIGLGDGMGALAPNGYYGVGNGVVGVESGDLDRDGDQDVVAIANDGGCSILINTGTGLFSTVPISVGSDVTDLALGDLNRDGILDMVVCSTADGAVMVKMGTGAPGFLDPVYYYPANGGVHVALGDVNGDGWLDAIADDPFNGEVAIFLNDGTGALEEPSYAATGDAIRDLALGDLNRDGKLDLALVRNPGPGFVSILLGNGTGGFGSPTYIPAGTDPRGITLGDPYADGILDLLVASGNMGSVLVLRGNGDGSFQPPVSHAASGTPVFVAQADLNRDGRPDLIAANGINTVSVLLGSDAVPTSVAEERVPAARATLAQNHPNPFNPRTEIRFFLPERSPVQLRVFDVAGRIVTTLADGSLAPGEYRVTWDGRNASGADAASGVYFYRLEAPGMSESRRMVLLR